MEYDDSDVYFEGGACFVGVVNSSLVPRFEADEFEDTTEKSSFKSGKGSNKR